MLAQYGRGGRNLCQINRCPKQRKNACYVYVVKATMEAGTIMFTIFTGAYIETGNGVLTQIRGNSVLR